MSIVSSDLRKKIFTDLVVVKKLGKISAEENLKLAEEIGNVPQAGDPRWETLIERPGVIKVTEGALFGHKETLDWHCNKPSNPERSPIIWIYAVKGSKGSVTSWINNKRAYEDLPNDVKEECKKVKITCGFKRGRYTDDPFFKEHHNRKLEHNLVYTNEAGVTGLFFPYLQILGGIQLDLFDYLSHHIKQDKYRYDHYWEDGDVVISEQWLTLHKRHAFEKMNERLMYRIAID